MVTFLVFILILSILVLVHELGHFVAAKWAGVRVEEFGFGIPPRIFGKKFGDTVYSINLLPFGGFVKLTGEDDVEDTSADEASFVHKSVLQRGLILVSGVFMNLILGIVLYYAFFIANGFRTLQIPMIFDYDFRFGRQESIDTVVASVLEDSAALEYGIRSGEAILEVDGVAVYNTPDVRREVRDRVGQSVKLLLMDTVSPAQEFRVVSVVPKANSEGLGILGVYLSKSVTLVYDSTFEKAFAGPMHAYNMLGYSGNVLSRLITLSFENRSVVPLSDSVAGPVGIYSVVGGILDSFGSRAYLGIIDITALMSLSLAIINILPFPALDGGRVLFVFFEAVFGKKVRPSFEHFLHRWGMILLLGILILITVRDAARFFG
jgi:regulator of sigma E protease